MWVTDKISSLKLKEPQASRQAQAKTDSMTSKEYVAISMITDICKSEMSHTFPISSASPSSL